MTVTHELLAPFADAERVVIDADLQPLIGSTIQPTGFANLGAATFERPGNPPSLLVESVQSLANHLEALSWDATAHTPIELLGELPYLAVHAEDGAFLTSSRLEPHRLAAAYVRDASIDGTRGIDWVAGKLGLVAGRPLDWPVIYQAIFQLDPLCLLHGVFFSDKGFHGNPKVRRAITLVIEGHDVREAVSGGLKRDDVAFKVEKGAGRGAEEGTGSCRSAAPSSQPHASCSRQRSTSSRSAATDCRQTQPSCWNCSRSGKFARCWTDRCGCVPAATWNSRSSRFAAPLVRSFPTVTRSRPRSRPQARVSSIAARAC